MFKKKGCLAVPPDWRAELVHSPEKYSISPLLYCEASDSGHKAVARQLCVAGQKLKASDIEKNGKPKGHKNYLFTNLPSFQFASSVFLDLKGDAASIFWKQYLKTANQIKKKQAKVDSKEPKAHLILPPTDGKAHVRWKVKKAGEIQDSWLSALVLHIEGVRCDPHIEEAIALRNNRDNSSMFAFVGYCFYAGYTPVEMAKKFNRPIRAMEAVQAICWDFSRMPAGKLAHNAYFKQLHNSKIIDDGALAIFERVVDFGKVGLKAQFAFSELSRDEKDDLESLLADEYIRSVYGSGLGVTTRKDLAVYSGALGGLHQRRLEAAKINVLIQSARVAEAKVASMAGSSVNYATEEDQVALAFVEAAKLRNGTFDEVREASTVFSEAAPQD